MTSDAQYASLMKETEKTAAELLAEAVRLDKEAEQAQAETDALVRLADQAIEKAMTCNATKEIATSLGTSRNTIYNRLARLHGKKYNQTYSQRIAAATQKAQNQKI